MPLKPSEFFDAAYFGHAEGERKSNYPAVGGYHAGLASSDQFVAWVLARGAEHWDEVDNASLRALDVGCATGTTVARFRALGHEAFGVDFSTYILSQASPDVKLYLGWGSMDDLQYNAFVMDHAPYDVICSKDVLEHATEDTIDKILLDMAEITTFQAHVVNTGQYPYQAWDGDKSHHIRQPLSWWKEKAVKLGIAAAFKET